jgi:hypothetical protein
LFGMRNLTAPPLGDDDKAIQDVTAFHIRHSKFTATPFLTFTATISCHFLNLRDLAPERVVLSTSPSDLAQDF